MLDNRPDPAAGLTPHADQPPLAFLSGAAMALGKTRRPVDSLSGLQAFFDAQGLPALPDLFGMAWFHEAGPDETSWSMATTCAQQTLAQSGVGADAIDALIFCSAHFTGSLDSSATGMQKLMQSLGVAPDFVTGVTLGRCTSFLSGLHLATSLVEGGRYKNALVICADRYLDDASRLQPFALFSDGAASCLVGRQAGPGRSYAIRGTSSRTDPQGFDSTGRISADMVRDVNQEIARETGIAFAQVTAFLPINIYRPVVFAAESQGGVPADRLFLENVPARGHCFGADPLINLIDRDAADALDSGAYALLCASVPGFRVALLLQAL